MEEMQAFASTLKIDIDPSDASKNGFFTLQHWYPRIWDEWARDKDGAVPLGTYADDESQSTFRIKRT